jgi:hypothetical protein
MRGMVILTISSCILRYMGNLIVGDSLAQLNWVMLRPCCWTVTVRIMYERERLEFDMQGKAGQQRSEW